MPQFQINSPGPMLTVEESDIFSAIEWAKKRITLKRGWKFTQELRIVENKKTGRNHTVAFVKVFNSKNVQQKGYGVAITALTPAVTQKVHSPFKPTVVIHCTNCGGSDFYDKGRSLDYYNWQCANCGKEQHTLTETGMCR